MKKKMEEIKKNGNGKLVGIKLDEGETNGRKWSKYTYSFDEGSEYPLYLSGFNEFPDMKLGAMYSYEYTEKDSGKKTAQGYSIMYRNIVSVSPFISADVLTNFPTKPEESFLTKIRSLQKEVNELDFVFTAQQNLNCSQDRAKELYKHYSNVKLDEQPKKLV